jgi:hypothetical protein
MYEDRDGILTSLFIEKGYLDSETWAGKTPEYYIEVKTTTMPHGTRQKYLSSPQQQVVSQIFAVMLFFPPHRLTSVCRCEKCPDRTIVNTWLFAFLTWVKSP